MSIELGEVVYSRDVLKSDRALSGNELGGHFRAFSDQEAKLFGSVFLAGKKSPTTGLVIVGLAVGKPHTTRVTKANAYFDNRGAAIEFFNNPRKIGSYASGLQVGAPES